MPESRTMSSFLFKITQTIKCFISISSFAIFLLLRLVKSKPLFFARNDFINLSFRSFKCDWIALESVWGIMLVLDGHQQKENTHTILLQTCCEQYICNTKSCIIFGFVNFGNFNEKNVAWCGRSSVENVKKMEVFERNHRASTASIA